MTMFNNINQVIGAVDKKIGKIDLGVRMARDEMMSRLIQLAKEEIQGERGVVGREIKFVDGKSKRGKKVYGEDPAISGKPPKNRTGNLRRSIKGQKFREGFATYSAIVGPTIIYGRRVELGGGNWPPGTKFPYMKPAFEKFRPEATLIVRKHLGK